MELLSKGMEDRIIKNIVACAKKNNPRNLGVSSYKFLYLCNGFIAHYNINGFIDYYVNEESLKHDILAFQDQNQWTNFREGEKDYEYYMQKKRMYNKICEGIK
jgi:hypothetical protein